MNQKPGKPQKSKSLAEKNEAEGRRTGVTECSQYIKYYARLFYRHIISSNPFNNLIRYGVFYYHFTDKETDSSRFALVTLPSMP